MDDISYRKLRNIVTIAPKPQVTWTELSKGTIHNRRHTVCFFQLKHWATYTASKKSFNTCLCFEYLKLPEIQAV